MAYNIRREYTTVDGLKRNGHVKRELAFLAEGAWPRSWSFSSCSMAWSFRPRRSTMGAHGRKHARGCATRSTSWRGWMRSPAICARSRNSTRGLTAALSAVHDAGTPHGYAGGQVGAEGEPCFYLISGIDPASHCSKIMLSPSGVASYSTDVT